MKSSLVSRITLKNFRGLAEANLEGLAPLTVLTGRNGCGKSTVLEGLFVGASPTPATNVGLVASRRANTPSGGRWLFSQGRHQSAAARTAEASLAVGFEDGSLESRALLWSEDVDHRVSTHLKGAEPFVQVIITGSDERIRPVGVILSADNRFVVSAAVVENFGGKTVRWIDTSKPNSELALILSRVRGSSFREEADELIRKLLPGAVRLDVSVSEQMIPFVDVTYREYAIPLSVAGDGVQAAVQLALELANIEPGGLALIEEPEAFLHPGGLLLVAKVLARTIKRGVQIVLTTHSLDLIDALAEAVADGDQEKLALFRLRLVEGKLHWGRYSGSEIALARFEVAEDLR